jgi:hypothetical protein
MRRVFRGIFVLMPVSAVLLGMVAPAQAAKPDILVAQVDLSYLMSDVSLKPCSFPVLIREVGRQIYGTYYDSNGGIKYYTAHGAETVTFTNLDTGETVVTFNAGQIGKFPRRLRLVPKEQSLLRIPTNSPGSTSGSPTVQFSLAMVRRITG